MYFEDTIVAPATAPGAAAVAIIRLSGPRAFQIARAVWSPAGSDREPVARRLSLGAVRDPETGGVIDRAMAAFFPAPHSLTGENVVELQCHGGVYLVRRILGLAAARGARMAEPGEFTRRAFLNGRIDLAAAEAIADIVAARGERALKLALDQLSGKLSEIVGGLRERVISIRAHLEAEIDFSDEQIDLPARSETADSIARLRDDILTLAASFDRGRIARTGIRAAIIGKPNAGKSSILNMMLGAERAIVTPIPGTTRDIIEDSIQLGGYAVILQDSAGIRASSDPVEQIGVERARRAAAEADLVIVVFDGAGPLSADDRAAAEIAHGRPGAALLNKCDLPAVVSASDIGELAAGAPVLRCSARTGAGIDLIRAELIRQIERLGGDCNDGVAISHERHLAALQQAAAALADARQSALAAMPPEIIAVDVALAAEGLGAITGAVTTEDVLDRIFRDFCIGK